MSNKKTLGVPQVEVFLRIDANEEINFIESLIELSKEEILEATGAKFEDFGQSEIYKMLQQIIIADRYENRTSTDWEFKKNNIYSQYCQLLRLKVE